VANPKFDSIIFRCLLLGLLCVAVSTV